MEPPEEATRRSPDRVHNDADVRTVVFEQHPKSRGQAPTRDETINCKPREAQGATRRSKQEKPR